MCIPVVGRLMSVDDGGAGVMEVDGVNRRVSLVLLALEGVSVIAGDWVRACTGLAMARLDEGEARAEAAALRALHEEEVG